MRPNIQISHQKNGRVKDYAAENGLTVPEAYEEIIDTGLDVLAGEKIAVTDGGMVNAFGAIGAGEEWEPFDCPVCDEEIATTDQLYDHARECAGWDI